MSDYRKQTDKTHIVTLTSQVTNATWGQKVATVGDKVKFFVQTGFVGNGSDIEIEVEDKSGKKLEKLKAQVYGDQFAGFYAIPEKAKEEITFTAKLKKHGLTMKSGAMIVVPLIKVTNLKWGQKEARRGDIVKLSADVVGLPDETGGMIIIYEYDQDGAHDFITKFPCRVKNKKVEAEWEYEYHEDTDEIPTQQEKEKYGKNYNPPEYFFVIDFYGQRFGDKQESELLLFRDWIEVLLTNGPEEPIPDEPYILSLPDGNSIEGKTDKEGRIKKENISPGNVWIEFPGLFNLVIMDKGKQIEGRDRGTQKIDIFSLLGGKPYKSRPVKIDKFKEQDIDNEEFDELEYDDQFTEPLERSQIVYFEGEKALEHPKYYKVAGAHRVSGFIHHVSVMHCITVCILTSSHEVIRQPIDYRLNDKRGKCVMIGQTIDGMIYYDEVGIGVYELIIDNQSYWVPSSDEANAVELVLLRSSKK
jgi:hypothetical protein